ncbi:DUF2207 domain-containing protein [Patescibacteria group bacterium]|nr:DUF2207 domain-containing protein [Patescibacteria group bacterium]
MFKINGKLKKFSLGLFFLIFFTLLFLEVGSYDFCQAALNKSYYYHSIEVDIQINQDSTFDVTEKQTYNLKGDFGYFYRDIELKDLDHISDIEVFDGQGKKLDKNEYKISYKRNRLSVQWNFPRKVFDNELRSWTIKYKVHGGLGFYEKWDELYWNAIFEDREVEVRQAEVVVHLPRGIEREQIGQKLFIGPLGSKTESSNYQVIGSQTVRFWGYNIMPHNFLTIVVTWPKGIVAKPFLYRNQIINWIILLIAFALPISFFVKMYILWRKRGKDPKIGKTIIAQYSPPENLPPAVFGVLIDQAVHMKDITATIIDLAVRGYLRIREKEKGFSIFKTREYTLEKLKDESDLLLFEQKIIRDIFKNKNVVSSDDLKNKFYKKIPGIEKSLHQEVGETGYFMGNILNVRKKYGKTSNKIFLLALVIFFGWLILSFLLGTGLVRYFAQISILGLSLIISATIILIFAHYMPSLTQKGLEAKWKLLGFKEYLQTAERFRLGAETLETFSKYLPFALILGVEKKWAERFSDFSYQKQNWYVPVVYAYGGGGKGGAPASFNSFSSSISSFTSSISRTFGGGAGTGGVGGVGGAAGGGGGGGGGGAG